MYSYLFLAMAALGLILVTIAITGLSAAATLILIKKVLEPLLDWLERDRD